VYCSSPFHLCATVIRKRVPVDLYPHSLRLPRLVISLRYLDVNNVGITYLPSVAPRSTRLRLVTHHSPTTNILDGRCFGTGSVSTFVGMSTSAGRSGSITMKHPADKPAITSQVHIVQLTKPTRSPLSCHAATPSIKVSEHARTSDLARNVRWDISQDTSVSFSLTGLYTLALFLRKMPAPPGSFV
jgi:hypothetical protein